MSAIYRPHLANSHPVAAKAFIALLLMLVVISSSFANRTYGPVKSKDYLSKIVNKSYPKSDLTKHQIMVAILRRNTEAFRGGNIHFLKQGVILNLPNETDIATIPLSEASALIAQHLTFFKRGKTGNFVNKALPSTKAEPTTAKEVVAKSPTQSALKSEIPTKMKIEIRKQHQTQNNKIKHVKSLEKISDQQNKTLSTLDDQIRVLEELLEEEKSKKNQPATSTTVIETDTTPTKDKEPAVEQTGTETDENNTAENAISSLESALSVATQEEDKKQAQPIINETVTTPAAENNTPTQEVAMIETTSIDSASTNSSINTESSIVSLIKKQSTPKLIALISAFTIGLFTLGYLLFGRNGEQSTVEAAMTTTAFETTENEIELSSSDTSIKLSEQTTLLDPVIKKEVSSTEPIKPVISDKTKEQDAEIKINMARAYMDMGYIDAAKESLEEVLKEGTAEQKDTVQQMLSML